MATDLSFDVNQLFSEIEARPVIWDASNELFKKRDKSKEAWVDVGRIVIPNFDTLKYAKQHEYLEQLKRRYYDLRSKYRIARMNGLPLPAGLRLTFLDKVWNLPPSVENSADASEQNGGEVASSFSSACKKEESSDEDGHNVINLKPVLSIKKIDSMPETKISLQRGRPKRHHRVSQRLKASKPLKQTKPSPKRPIVRPEQPIVDSDVESKDEGGTAKRCRYEVETASTRASTPRIATYASLSIEEDRQSDRRIVPSHSFEFERPAGRFDGHESYDRPVRPCDMYDRPAPDRGYSPPAPRRQESFFDPRMYPMVPYPAAPLDYHDEDMAFFRSLLTWTKRFSEEEKMEFRSEVMRLVSRIRSFESTANYYVLSETPLS